MNEEEIKKIARETFIENVMNNLNSAIIFKYIQELEKENARLKDKINMAIKYYQLNQQECVIGRNKDEKLIKEYYLPAQCSKRLLDILKEN